MFKEKKKKITVPEQIKVLNNCYIHRIPRVPSNVFMPYEKRWEAKYPPFIFKYFTDFEVQKILYGIKTNAL